MTGSENTAVGVEALSVNSTGSNNTAIGSQALYSAAGTYNIGLGYQAGNGLTTGSSNIDLSLIHI